MGGEVLDVVFDKTAFNVKYWGRLSKPQFIVEARLMYSNKEPEARDEIIETVYKLIHDAARTETGITGV